MSSLALTSDSNILDVNFHSDESFTDKGFSAEYRAYDPDNRELKVLCRTHSYTTLGEMGETLRRDSDTHSLPLHSETQGVTV